MLEGDFYPARFSGFCQEAGRFDRAGQGVSHASHFPLERNHCLATGRGPVVTSLLCGFHIVFPRAVTFREQGEGRWAGFSTRPSLAQPAELTTDNAELQALSETGLLQVVPSAQLAGL